MTTAIGTPNLSAGPGSQEPTPFPRQRGGQKGNQNARRRTGVYGKHEDVWEVFLAAREVRGLTDEIAMLRVRIKHLYIKNAPMEDILTALKVLNQLLVTHHRLMDPDGDVPYDE